MVEIPLSFVQFQFTGVNQDKIGTVQKSIRSTSGSIVLYCVSKRLKAEVSKMERVSCETLLQ